MAENTTTMKLQANTVTADEEGPITHIGFADDVYDTKEYVLLSYNLDEPEEGLHIEINDQKWSGYRLVKTVQLLDSSAVIELTENGAKQLNAGPSITISIQPKVQNWPLLIKKIATLLTPWVQVIVPKNM